MLHLQALNNLVPGLEPRRIFVDLERAVINSFQVQFPGAEVKGCYFHLSQSVIREVGKLGMKVRFAEEIDFYVLVKCLPALAFMPPDEVEVCFNILQREFLVRADDEQDEITDLTYFKNTYISGPEIGGRVRNAKFPINLWNHFNEASESLSKLLIV